ncbi:MAG: sulfurtransferase TusA family protein [Methanosarcinales archaeon]|nr:sulfurtransferase TusA family protein [ANME-2 cluster archaeon]MDF1530830.1 sulfurtransferase TusA family protein [ANME-2 cluster archaeon]MDW7776487.1 sulfurtransferase TusA family protein [Methanosarcinales archaeon]
MVTAKLDLKGEECPFTFVKTKLKLEELESGDTLVATYDHEPAIGNVPRSLKAEGHKIISIEEIGTGVWNITIEKA